MRVTNHPPVLVPYKCRHELARMSKAFLMDMVWSLAGRTVESSDNAEEVAARIRHERDVVRSYRR